MMAKRPRSKKHIERMVALVNEHAENEGILKHIGWLLTVTQGQLPEGVLEVLGKHKESAKFSQILPYLAMSAEGSEGKELFNWVRKSSPHKEVQAMAAYANSMSRGISEDV